MTRYIEKKKTPFWINIEKPQKHSNRRAKTYCFRNCKLLINQHMKVRVYVCRETDPQAILKASEISEQALNTIYELGDIIQLSSDFYMGNEVGAKQIEVIL